MVSMVMVDEFALTLFQVQGQKFESIVREVSLLVVFCESGLQSRMQDLHTAVGKILQDFHTVKDPRQQTVIQYVETE